jgi:hypothetical protein
MGGNRGGGHRIPWEVPASNAKELGGRIGEDASNGQRHDERSAELETVTTSPDDSRISNID